jgi:hypothetical protein
MLNNLVDHPLEVFPSIDNNVANPHINRLWATCSILLITHADISQGLSEGAQKLWNSGAWDFWSHGPMEN